LTVSGDAHTKGAGLKQSAKQNFKLFLHESIASLVVYLDALYEVKRKKTFVEITSFGVYLWRRTNN
jgi:hypothetical protein